MAAFYVAILRLYKKCHFFVTCHNTFRDKIVLTRFAYRKAKVIACGDMVKRNLVDVFGITEESISVVRNAVKPFENNVEIDPLLEELHIKGCNIIGNIGRLSEQKGMEYYISAMPYVIEKCPNARFLIVGTGEEENKLRALAKELCVEENL